MLIMLYLFLAGIFAGLIGSIIGIGGGILIVPFLALVLKTPIHLAIGTSMICVLATSLSASVRFFKKNMINTGLALVMEIPTTVGSIAGSITVAFLKNDVLFIIFGCFTIVSGIFTYLKNRFPDVESWQIHATGKKDYRTLEGIRVAPAVVFLKGLI